VHRLVSVCLGLAAATWNTNRRRSRISARQTDYKLSRTQPSGKLDYQLFGVFNINVLTSCVTARDLLANISVTSTVGLRVLSSNCRIDTLNSRLTELRCKIWWNARLGESLTCCVILCSIYSIWHHCLCSIYSIWRRLVCKRLLDTMHCLQYNLRCE